MLTQVYPHVQRLQMVNALANIAHEWREAAEGESLIEMQTSVGMLLFDVVLAIGLNRAEQEAVLGADLRKELLHELTAHNGNGNH